MRSTSLGCALLSIILFLQSPGLGAQAYDALFVPDKAMAAAALASEPLSAMDLAELGLRASGVTEAQLGPRLGRIQAILAELGASLDAQGLKGEAARAEACLTWLHRKIFTTYVEGATTLDLILDTGRFNCVSSAVLYLIALRSQGISCVGVKTWDHAFCLVRADGRSIDVETTNPYGFDPGTKKEFSGAFGATTGYAYVPPTRYSDRTTIGQRQLVALILSNRIADYEASGRFPEALPLGISYALLYGGNEGRRLLLDCVENLASRLAGSSDYAGIEALSETAARVTGPDPRLQALTEKSVYNRLTLAANRGDWRGARTGAEAAYASGKLGRASYDAIVAASYAQEAQALGERGDWLAAAALAEEGAAKVKGDQGLARAASVFRRNFVVTSHNRFVALFNKGDYAGAAGVIEEALQKLPGNSDLLSDLEAARRAEARKK